MTTSVNMLLLFFPQAVSPEPPPGTQLICKEDLTTIVISEDGAELITES